MMHFGNGDELNCYVCIHVRVRAVAYCVPCNECINKAAAATTSSAASAAADDDDDDEVALGQVMSEDEATRLLQQVISSADLDESARHRLPVALPLISC